MSQPYLVAEGLTKNFDRLSVLKDVNFTLARGEVIGLVGRQGAGKSTLFHLLNGGMLPSSGRILLDGIPQRLTTRDQAQQLGVETIYQISNPIDQFNVANNFLSDRELWNEVTRRTSGLV